MPLDKLIHPQTGETLSLEEAPMRFEEDGVMPAEAACIIIDDSAYSHKLPVVNPSMADPESNCRRAVLLKKYIPYAMDPQTRWAAIEGTFMNQIWDRQITLPGWHRQVYVPAKDGSDKDHPKVKAVKVPWQDEPVYHAEVFPGWWTRTRIDRASPDWSTLIDHKTTKYAVPWKLFKGVKAVEPYTKFEERDVAGKFTLQLSIEAHMIELIKGVEVKELFVWRTYRGSQRNDRTFKKYPVRKMGYDEVWHKIKDHVLSLQEYMERCEVEDKFGSSLEGIFRECPADGYQKQMFNGWLCREGCPVKEMCMTKLEGGMAF